MRYTNLGLKPFFSVLGVDLQVTLCLRTLSVAPAPTRDFSAFLMLPSVCDPHVSFHVQMTVWEGLFW